ncbi:hypothetical protein P168DRAFT_25891 [Aspergillus campestris IBT 28561]|uniref:Uncharacterized protein n=1 Tax=Aspergillus campestris (strain IBT 28561) TaxID=1392248 RepID=A0A2I1DG95_ASPC2|nr:uncharacterized protein P168DRAFT_25891 [Aspergillus campestris IBT 28561]PKY08888.1 hypothetical protein P168DRAFT_25891 [Aspergillus campestris IBT 28561]
MLPAVADSINDQDLSIPVVRPLHRRHSPLKPLQSSISLTLRRPCGASVEAFQKPQALTRLGGQLYRIGLFLARCKASPFLDRKYTGRNSGLLKTEPTNSGKCRNGGAVIGLVWLSLIHRLNGYTIDGRLVQQSMYIGETFADRVDSASEKRVSSEDA